MVPPVARVAVPFRVVASDMDGTLLDPHHHITEYTKETLFRLAVEKGVQFIFATGRHHLSVAECRTDLESYFAEHYKELQAAGKADADSTPPGFYLVTSNGARVHDPSGKLIISHDLDPDVVLALYTDYGLPYTSKKYAGPPGQKTPSLPATPVTASSVVSPTTTMSEGSGGEEEDIMPEEVISTSAYTTNEWFITVPFLPMEQMRVKFGVYPRVVPFARHDDANVGKSVFDSFPVEGVGKVCFRSTDRKLLAKLERDITLRFGDRVSVAFSSNSCLDVMCGGVSKASGLREIGAQLVPIASMEDVIAFGDSMNDEEMLRRAGKGCVMENGQPRLKEALPQCEVIGTNVENGVARKLREVFGL